CLIYCVSFFFFFFFQAEDGIRDRTVTGVQTCALPIYEAAGIAGAGFTDQPAKARTILRGDNLARYARVMNRGHVDQEAAGQLHRSEERRVGKEGRSRWSRYQEKKKDVEKCRGRGMAIV